VTKQPDPPTTLAERDRPAVEITPAMIEEGAYIVEAETSCMWPNALNASRQLLELFREKSDALR
jgi:hypothetical protein